MRERRFGPGLVTVLGLSSLLSRASWPLARLCARELYGSLAAHRNLDRGVPGAGLPGIAYKTDAWDTATVKAELERRW
jgi:hypothetical protein